MDRARVVNAAAGVALLSAAAMMAAYAFVTHERLYALGVFVIGLLAFSFLFLIGIAYSLIFQTHDDRRREFLDPP